MELRIALNKPSVYATVSITGVTKGSSILPSVMRTDTIRRLLEYNADSGSLYDGELKLLWQKDNTYDKNALCVALPESFPWVGLRGKDIGFIPKKGQLKVYYPHIMAPDTFKSIAINTDIRILELSAKLHRIQARGLDLHTITLKLWLPSSIQ